MSVQKCIRVVLFLCSFLFFVCFQAYSGQKATLFLSMDDVLFRAKAEDLELKSITIGF